MKGQLCLSMAERMKQIWRRKSETERLLPSAKWRGNSFGWVCLFVCLYLATYSKTPSGSRDLKKKVPQRIAHSAERALLTCLAAGQCRPYCSLGPHTGRASLLMKKRWQAEYDWTDWCRPFTLRHLPAGRAAQQQVAKSQLSQYSVCVFVYVCVRSSIERARFVSSVNLYR